MWYCGCGREVGGEKSCGARSEFLISANFMVVEALAQILEGSSRVV